MAGCELSVEEIFVSLFCRERFVRSTHTPYFLQNFAPTRVQRAMQDEHAKALLNSAALLLKPHLHNHSYSAAQSHSPRANANASSVPTDFSFTASNSASASLSVSASASATDSATLASATDTQPHSLRSNVISALDMPPSAARWTSEHGVENSSSSTYFYHVSNSYQSYQGSQSSQSSQGSQSSQSEQGSQNTNGTTVAAGNADANHAGQGASRLGAGTGIGSGTSAKSTMEQISEVADAVAAESARLHGLPIPSLLVRNQLATMEIGSCYDFDDLCVAVRYALEEDRLQFMMSSAFRCLQQKTQVFPLDINASTRSRLTHSYEVAGYTKLCVTALVERMPKLRPIFKELATISESTALMHDVGNPPFGHFGEQVIRDWVADICRKERTAVEHGAQPTLNFSQMDDLLSFNGNAQGLRVLHSLSKLNLSLGLLHSVIKVPYTYAQLRSHGMSEHNAHVRTGIFLSEAPLLERIAKTNLGHKRHPMSLIMEQCDDLAYVLADLEDAYDRHVLSDLDLFDLFESLIEHLRSNACYSSCDVCTSACAIAQGDSSPATKRVAAEAAVTAAAKLAAMPDDCRSHDVDMGTVHDAVTTAEEDTESPAEHDQHAHNLAHDLLKSNTMINQLREIAQLSPLDSLGSAAHQAAVEREARIKKAAFAAAKKAARDKSYDLSASTSDIAAAANRAASQVEAAASSQQNSDVSEGLSKATSDSSSAAASVPASAASAAAVSKTVEQIKILHPLKLDVVLTDAIRDAYACYKDDGFGVLPFVHGNTPLSLRTMMQELGVMRMFALLRECLGSYYIVDIIDAIEADEVGFFCEGVLNITSFGNDAHKAIEFLKQYEQDHIYTDRQVESLELQGAAVLRGLLDKYSVLLELDSSEFLNCVRNDRGDSYVRHLLHRIPKRYIDAYLELYHDHPLAEHYARIRLIIDHIAAMPDTYALSEYQLLTGGMMQAQSFPF